MFVSTLNMVLDTITARYCNSQKSLKIFNPHEQAEGAANHHMLCLSRNLNTRYPFFLTIDKKNSVEVVVRLNLYNLDLHGSPIA